MNMEVTFLNGEKAVMVKSENGFWHCPVCGSPELEQPAYENDGSASFQMCSCGFEFGFDDDPAASGTSIKSIIGNWEAWRAKTLRSLQAGSSSNY